MLCKMTSLSKTDYKVVHFDSDDTRGIDCALLYRTGVLVLADSKPCNLNIPNLHTRDILLAQFISVDSDSIAVMINHHPSKHGGKGTDVLRRQALERLAQISDSLERIGWQRRIAVGDFNDEPENAPFEIMSPSLEPARMEGREKGSIRFNGDWQLIDLCFVSPELVDATTFRVVSIPFLTQRDVTHSGEKPLRTYSGPRYLGGVSDHRPILARITSDSGPPIARQSW